MVSITSIETKLVQKSQIQLHREVALTFLKANLILGVKNESPGLLLWVNETTLNCGFHPAIKKKKKVTLAPRDKPSSANLPAGKWSHSIEESVLRINRKAVGLQLSSHSCRLLGHTLPGQCAHGRVPPQAALLWYSRLQCNLLQVTQLELGL